MQPSILPSRKPGSTHVRPGPTCPNCLSGELSIFHQIAAVPVHSVLLFHTHEAACNYPKGQITLGLCPHCGFICNTSFNPELHEYSGLYESTQSYSESFNAFHRDLAARLIARYGLHHKDILEIGCGQGEFLRLLCEMGENRGIGFDPAYHPPAAADSATTAVTIYKDFYSEQYSAYKADFYVCKMTLEHIHNPAHFVRMVRRAIGDNPEAVVFFQVPDVTRILDEVAFWDIYYEHCSYFSPASLAYLFQSSEFDIVEQQTAYAGQYLMLTTRPGNHKAGVQAEGVAEITRRVGQFARSYASRAAGWRSMLAEAHSLGQACAIWGAGSKGVAFLTTLGLKDEIACAVDINPNKRGTYMAGSGHVIVSPEDLREYRPEIIFVMNPIYKPEIEASLAQVGLSARLVLVE